MRITTGSTDATTVLRAEYQNIYSALAHNNQLQHCVLKLKTASGGVIYMDTIQSQTYNDLGQVATLKRSGHRADMSYEYDLLQGHLKGIHYYVQDYQGNNRMVINRNATSASAPEQITHYYPYGGVIGDISTNEDLQKFKFEGKELDRSFGLDNYDIHARNYFAMLPMWDRVDPLAEKYYGISPYVYCGGDPVNRGDYDGKWIQCAFGALIGGLIDAGFEYKESGSLGKTAIAFGKGAVNGAVAATGAGVIVSAIVGAETEMVGQIVEVLTGLEKNVDGVEIGKAAAQGFAGALLSKTPTKWIHKNLEKQITSSKNIYSAKQKAEVALKQEGKFDVSAKEIKRKGQSLRKKDIKRKEGICDQAVNSTIQIAIKQNSKEDNEN